MADLNFAVEKNMNPDALIWTEHRAPDGRLYWYNTVTKQSSWTKPEALLTPAERRLTESPWKEFTAPNGKKYWNHAQTKQSTWEMPAEYRQLLDEIAHESAKPPVESGIKESSVKEASAQDDAKSVVSATSSAAPSTQFAGYPASVHSGISGMTPHTMAPAVPVPQFETKEQAEQAFFSLLKHANVDRDWTWEQTMRAIIHHPMYRSLKTNAERKEAFEKYLMDKRRADREAARQKAQQSRQELREMLEKSDQVTVLSHYKKCEKLFGDKPEWKAVTDDRDRREIVDAYISELKRKEREAERDLRKRNLEKFTTLLQSVVTVTEDTNWKQAWSIVESSKEFLEDEELKEFPKVDCLTIFEDIIKRIDREGTQKRRQIKENRIREERKNRDAFRELLTELREKRTLHVDSKWKEIYELVKDDERFLNMVGQPGSTPLDLYRDVIVELEDEVYEDGQYVKEILKRCGFVVMPDTKYDEFISVISKDRKYSRVRQHLLPPIFNALVDKAKMKLHEEQKKVEKKLRYIYDGFKYMLKKADPPITSDQTWAEVRSRFIGRSAFEEAETEDVREQFFEKYIHRLQQKEKENSSKRSQSESEAENYSERRRKRSHQRSSSRHRDEKQSLRERTPDNKRQRTETIQESSSEEGEI